MSTNQLCMKRVILLLSVGTGWWSLIFFYNGGYSLIFISCAASKLPVKVGVLIKHRASYLKNIKSSPTDCSHRASPYSTHGSTSCSLFDVLLWIRCPGWWFHKPFFLFTGGTVACWERSVAWHLWKMSCGNKGWVLLGPLRVCVFFTSQIFTDKRVGVSPRLQVNWS